MAKQVSFSETYEMIEQLENEWAEMVERLVELNELRLNDDGDLYWVASGDILGNKD